MRSHFNRITAIVFHDHLQLNHTATYSDTAIQSHSDPVVDQIVLSGQKKVIPAEKFISKVDL